MIKKAYKQWKIWEKLQLFNSLKLQLTSPWLWMKQLPITEEITMISKGWSLPLVGQSLRWMGRRLPWMMGLLSTGLQKIDLRWFFENSRCRGKVHFHRGRRFAPVPLHVYAFRSSSVLPSSFQNHGSKMLWIKDEQNWR